MGIDLGWFRQWSFDALPVVLDAAVKGVVLLSVAGLLVWAMARPGELEGRLLAILDPLRNRRTLTRLGMSIATALVVAVAVPLAVVRAGESPKPAVLEFRIAPRPSDLDDAERASYTDWLADGKTGFWWKDGRVAGIAGRLPRYAWLPVYGELANGPELMMGMYNGRSYVLVSDKPGEAMVPAAGANAWGLSRVVATTDDDQRPAVRFELDARGAQLFAALTKAHVNRALAVVFDGEVVSAPTVISPVGTSGMITGRFAERDVAMLVEALRVGLPPGDGPADSGQEGPEGEGSSSGPSGSRSSSRPAAAGPTAPATTVAPQPAPPAEAATPTADTLEQWLRGKDVVDVYFKGPRMDLEALRQLLPNRGEADPAVDPTYRLTPGEGGGDNRGFVFVQMKATPENVKRLLSLQKDLAEHGFVLDAGATRLWSYQGDAAKRTKAKELVRQVLATAAAEIRGSLPEAQIGNEREQPLMYLAGLRYEVPGTQVAGMIRVNEITPERRWALSATPALQVHLPHLGLMVSAYYRPGEIAGLRDTSPEHAAILSAVRRAVAPLAELDGGALVREWPFAGGGMR